MKQPVDSTLPRVAFDFIVKAKMEIFCLIGRRMKKEEKDITPIYSSPRRA
jgi:hypothetical protein